MNPHPVLDAFYEQRTPTDDFAQQVLNDFWICCVSREVSLLGRKEVLLGKAKFGIFGDGKELPQVAMARAFKKGDWRSGYYRDQTFMMALGLCTVEDLFAQLYADPDHDHMTKGRQMNAHFVSPTIDKNGAWLDHLKQFNISADISSTASQMARALGIALASKLYRESNLSNTFSHRGNEVSFCTIGDASTSEGVFWESINAAAVMQVPLAVSVWDDGYGISVPRSLQTAKNSISKALAGMIADGDKGIEVYSAKAWDYPALVELYERGIKRIRQKHIPALFHIEDCTQPQGHSTSGSHERYKSEDRLAWEQEKDGITLMGNWMMQNEIIHEDELEDLRAAAKKYAKEGMDKAWTAFQSTNETKRKELLAIVQPLKTQAKEMAVVHQELNQLINPTLHEITMMARNIKYDLLAIDQDIPQNLERLISEIYQKADEDYHSTLYAQGSRSALNVPVVPKIFSADSPSVPGFKILNTFFDQLIKRDDRVFAFGEDVGHIGDVNQGFAGLQGKYGDHRVFDTGIREWTIMGQAIGMAIRGMRPIAEIQYLDYLIYGLQPLSDDLATLRYRSAGQQMAPAIIRTRGHRLEGIWHAGSPLAVLINALRGMYIMCPRDMVQAVGFYNTMMQSDDPGLIIECLNGYRLRERMPDNIGTYTVPLGVPEILVQGTDITLITYGSCVRLAQKAVAKLHQHGIRVELVDVQTLLPFDLEHIILQSIQKTNRVLFLDEDVPGGTTAYMMQQVLEVQGAYHYLDAAPVTLTAHQHRPPYGSMGDYFSKPNAEDIFVACYQIMHEADPQKFGHSFEDLR